jgi:iron(III) transport system ATP-binding protein
VIAIRHLAKRFETESGRVTAMDDLTLEVEAGSFFTLLGPSGCGKSTLLRCLAGLETPDAGEIRIGERVVFSAAARIHVPPNKRRIGMVFQSYAIWPHMTVYQNVAFPLEVQRQPRIRERVDRALAMVELGALGARYASRLSGGQQQRVALARAIVAEPELLLLDEPLSNLDAALRGQMCDELRRLHERLRLTTIYVTHDQAEALSLSDRVAVMREGRFVEIAAPETLYAKPRSVFAAQFIGGANIIEGEARPSGTGSVIETALGRLWSERAASGPVTVFIRPEHVRLLGESDPVVDERNLFAGSVRSDRFIGDSRQLELSLAGGAVLRCKIQGDRPVDRASVARVMILPANVEVLDS